jgi:uncharacterized protein (DUF1697 family)
MPRYIALLRGVNVGGRTVKMDKLRAVLTALGFDDVETLIASGNVLFRSPSRGDAALEKKIEAALAEAFGFAVKTMVRSAAEMQRIAALEPFGRLGDSDTLHVAFLHSPPPKDGLAKVLALRDANTDMTLDGRELYFKVTGRFSDSVAFRSPIEKLLGVAMTVRNANTVRKLAAKTGE